MNIAVLTSSRADYSIYYPLLKILKEDAFFDLHIIAFGAHVSQGRGYTVQYIENDGFEVKYRIESLPSSDSPQAIAESMGNTMLEFAQIWAKEKYDLVIALGDRYEMFSAVSSSVPFNVKIAHIHGGETTHGAIDDAFRHAITLMSEYHFTAADQYRKRVLELKGSDLNVHNTGALSIDNLKQLKLLSIQEFKNKFNIDLGIPTILITFHPATVSFERNSTYIEELVKALELLKEYQLVITMPNADTMGNLIRQKLNDFIEANKRAIGVESFGTIGYLTCMKHCSFMLGNTSSGFIEASFFPKYVINLGERQTGRIVTPNIINCTIEKEAILSAVKQVEAMPNMKRIDVYGDGNAAEKIIAILKTVK